MTAALLDDVELAILTVIIARGDFLTNGDAQRLRGHIEALGEKYAAAMALAEAADHYDRALHNESFVIRDCGDILERRLDPALIKYREATR